jgi:hypothetical protein
MNPPEYICTLDVDARNALEARYTGGLAQPSGFDHVSTTKSNSTRSSAIRPFGKLRQAPANNGQGTLEPNLRPPSERISSPQIPTTRPKNKQQLSIFGLPNDYRITERRAAALSHRKQGGMDEIHLFGIHRAWKIRRDDR